MSKDVFSARIGGEYTYPSAIGPPVTVAFHAHAQSPNAAELIAQSPNNPDADPNPHNEQLRRTRYDAAFSDLNVRLQTMDRQRIADSRQGCIVQARKCSSR